MQQIPPAQLGEATRWGSIWGGRQADPSRLRSGEALEAA